MAAGEAPTPIPYPQVNAFGAGDLGRIWCSFELFSAGNVSRVEGDLRMGVIDDIAKTGRGLIEGREQRIGQGEGILSAGRNVIDGMKVTTGTGIPDSGDAFRAGAEQLGRAGDTLQSAFPDDSWHSNGSTAYTARNNEQLSRTAAMIEADHAVAAVLARESAQISTTRENLAGQSDWLADMSLVTTAIGTIPYVGKAAQIATEIAMVARAVGASTCHLLTMQQNVDANAAELQFVAEKYSDIARDTLTRDDDGKPVENAPDQAERDQAEGAVSGPAASAVPAAVTTATQQAPPQPPAAQQAAPASGVARPPAAGDADMAATMAGTAIGSILGPLGGILGGITQAASQALQAAVQAATQTVQDATQTVGAAQPNSAALDTQAEKVGVAGDDKSEKYEKDEKDDKSEKNKNYRADDAVTPGAKAEKGWENGTFDDGGVVTDGAGPTDKGAAKTLPPDLAASEFTRGDGRAPARAEVDSDQAQLSVPAAVRLGVAIPGSTPVTRT
jgi:hypothetical protein